MITSAYSVRGCPGAVLKQADAAITGDVILEMNFKWLLPKNDAGVTLQIWHTTDDDCGPACDRMAHFLSDVANMAKYLGPDDPIRVEPHFLFVNCTNTGAPLFSRLRSLLFLWIATLRAAI